MRLRWLWRMAPRYLFQRGRLERELDDELRAHLAIEIQRRRERGESAEEARRRALTEMRGMTFVGENTRDARPWALAVEIALDVRYACRVLGKTPGFTGIAVLSVAIGIAASAGAGFSAIRSVKAFAPSATRRTPDAPLTGKRQQPVPAAGLAVDPKEALCKNAAVQKGTELPLDELGTGRSRSCCLARNVSSCPATT